MVTVRKKAFTSITELCLSAGKLEDLMTTALEDGNVEVVRILVQKRLVMMKTYLTKHRLGDLYKLVKHAITLPYYRSLCCLLRI